MAISLPHVFKAKELASGKAVNENLETIIAALEAGGFGASSVIAKYVAGEETRAEEEAVKTTEFHTMPTKDEVTIVLPAESLLAVAYHATWVSSVGGAGRAAVFLGSSQLKNNAATPAVIEASTSGATANALVTEPGALSSTGAGYTGDVETGQIVPSPQLIFAAAGTIKVSVRFLATSGTIKAKARKLWVWVA